MLDRPEPEARFEEFGENSLVFQLLYWTDPNKTQRERLESDLRFMIDKALNEAGITVAFPQRDINFRGPLQIERDPASPRKTPDGGDLPQA